MKNPVKFLFACMFLLGFCCLTSSSLYAQQPSGTGNETGGTEQGYIHGHGSEHYFYFWEDDGLPFTLIAEIAKEKAMTEAWTKFGVEQVVLSYQGKKMVPISWGETSGGWGDDTFADLKYDSTYTIHFNVVPFSANNTPGTGSQGGN